MMKRLATIIISAVFAGAVMVSCKGDGYVASVTELQLAGVSPSTGYSGGIVKILGRNFSEVFGENRVFVGELEAQVLEYNAWDLKVVLPEQKPGLYPITVTTPKGTVTGIEFEYKERPEHEYILSTVAGGTAGFEDGNGAEAKLSQPEGLALDSNGNLWIAQRGTHGTSIRKMDQNHNVTTVAETELPWHCSFNAGGDFYFAAKATNKIFMIAAADGAVSQVNLAGAELNNPMDVEFDNDGAMWVASRDNDKVYKAADGAVSLTYDIKYPTCLTLDTGGRIIVGSTTSGYVYMIDGNGEPVAIAGNGTYAKSENPNGNAGDTSTASVGQVSGIFAAKDGSLWFGDVMNKMVRRLVPDASGDYTKGRIETIAEGLYAADVCVTDDCTRAYVSVPTGDGAHTIRLIEVF